MLGMENRLSEIYAFYLFVNIALQKLKNKIAKVVVQQIPTH